MIDVESVRIGDYIGLRSKWRSDHLGYTLPSLTSLDWDRYAMTPEGKQHKENTDTLSREFDSRVWPKILEIVSSLESEFGPFEHPGEFVKTEAMKRHDDREFIKAASRAFSPRRRR